MGGILRVKTEDKKGIYVDFSSVLWFKPPVKQQEIIDYWHSQGFAEAEEIAYTFIDGYLVVTKDLPEIGFMKESGTLDEQIYLIPF
jgi:hypothetical protein